MHKWKNSVYGQTSKHMASNAIQSIYPNTIFTFSHIFYSNISPRILPSTTLWASGFWLSNGLTPRVTPRSRSAFGVELSRVIEKFLEWWVLLRVAMGEIGEGCPRVSVWVRYTYSKQYRYYKHAVEWEQSPLHDSRPRNSKFECRERISILLGKAASVRVRSFDGVNRFRERRERWVGREKVWGGGRNEEVEERKKKSEYERGEDKRIEKSKNKTIAFTLSR